MKQFAIILLATATVSLPASAQQSTTVATNGAQQAQPTKGGAPREKRIGSVSPQRSGR